MEVEKYTVPCLIDGNIRDVSVELIEDELCKITYDDGQSVLSYEAEHYWGALIELRKQLEAEGKKLLCQGCASNVYPSGMILDMGAASRAYKLTLGQQARMADLVFILDPCEPDEYATIEEQEAFYEAWIKGEKR